MLRLFCLLAVVGLAVGDTVILNQLVDQLLGGLSGQLVAAGKDSIAINELHEEFPYKRKYFSITGHLDCTDGHAKSLASIHRTGDVSMTTAGNAITLKVALGLGTLEADFTYCRVSVQHVFSFTEHMEAAVSSNSIEAQITVVKNGNQCNARVDRIALADLGKITLKTGGSGLHQIEDLLLNWLLQLFHGSIVGGINSTLEDAARNNIDKVDFCSHLPF